MNKAQLDQSDTTWHIHIAIPLPPGWDEDETWEWLAQGLALPSVDEPDGWANYEIVGECDLCTLDEPPSYEVAR